MSDDVSVDIVDDVVITVDDEVVAIDVPEQGPPGPQGPPGAPGLTGPANTLTIGTVTASDPGGDADAEITGTAPNQVLALTIPRGEQGPQGIQGIQGPAGATGPAGPANTLTIGTVTASAPGGDAAATITGTAPNQTLNLTIPRGVAGPEAWAAPVDYVPDMDYTATPPRSVVVVSGESYVCLIGHHSYSLAGFFVDLAAGKWMKVTTRGAGGLANRIANSEMAICQRAGSSTITASSNTLTWTVDRFYVYSAGVAATAYRQTATPLARNALSVERGIGASGALSIGYRAEAADVWDLGGQTVTMSMDLRHSSLGDTIAVGWQVYHANSVNTFGTPSSPTRTLIASGSWDVIDSSARYSATIDLPTGAHNGIEIVVTATLSVGVRLVTSRWQLEPGATATPWIPSPTTVELERCRRYYRHVMPAGVCIAYSATQAFFRAEHPGMYATPTPTLTGVVTISDPAFDGTKTQSTATVSTDAATTNANGGSYRLEAFSGLTAGRPYLWWTNNAIALTAEIP